MDDRDGGTAGDEWHPRPSQSKTLLDAVSQRKQALQPELYTPLLFLWAKTYEAPPVALTVCFGEHRAISVADMRSIVCVF